MLKIIIYDVKNVTFMNILATFGKWTPLSSSKSSQQIHGFVQYSFSCVAVHFKSGWIVRDK